MPTVEECNANYATWNDAQVARGERNAEIELDSPAGTIAPITRSDTVDFPLGLCRAILCGTEGTATLKDATGTTRTLVPLQKGYNPIRACRILLAGTASDLWALY